jgi:hypothetical protein
MILTDMFSSFMLEDKLVRKGSDRRCAALYPASKQNCKKREAVSRDRTAHINVTVEERFFTSI